MSSQVLLHLRQQRREIQAVGAGLARRVQVGAGPVAGGGGEGSELLAGLGAVAEVLEVGEEAGQVAELGRRAGGERAAAVAIGAEGRALGEEGVAELLDLAEL